MNRIILALSVAACTPATAELAAEALPEACEDSTCVREGVHDFEPAGQSARELHVFLPEDPVGAPVLFAWHHLTGSPEELLTWMPLQQATAEGFIVVAPRSRALFGTEWDLAPGSANEDLQLFDAVLDDLISRYDAQRLAYTTGFSAGGLFSTLLTLHSSERLAASAPFSGGSPPASYVTPAEDVPVMLSWGGPSDTAVGFDFAAATTFAAGALREDGHEVWTCEHALGHWLPADATSRTLGFFEAIRSDAEVQLAGCEH